MSLNQSFVNYAATDKKRNFNPSSNQGGYNNNNNSNKGGDENRNRGRNRYSPYPQSNKPTCQICRKYGHVVDVCYQSDHYKGYWCLSSLGQIFISLHVCFNEHDFPYLELSTINKNPTPTTLDTIFSWLPITQKHIPLPSYDPSTPSPVISPLSPSTQSTLTWSTSSPSTSSPISPSTPLSNRNSPSSSQTNTITSLPTNIHPMTTKAKADISKPRQFYGCLAQLPTSHDWSQLERTSYHEAASSLV
ncbi:unnamed protein product [Citrullus colocynthis]|uniref:Uncharacterized protein n=1 Tax=Citrullus colocynthis TaxID=252529 RepID=A0ABP0Y134_9ROSI